MTRKTAYKTKSIAGIELLIPACNNIKKRGPLFIHAKCRQPQISKQGYAVVSAKSKHWAGVQS